MIRFGVFYIYGIFYVADYVLVTGDWVFISSGLFQAVYAVDLRFLKTEGNDRSVNLALDTVVEFDNKDHGADIKFLDNVQKFIGKVKTVIVKKNLRRNFNTINNKKFTDFVLSLIQILLKYKDTDLKDLFTVIKSEIRKYHYKGCKFYELIENYDLRTFLGTKLHELKNTPPEIMRYKLKALGNKIEEEKYNLNEKELIDYINSLYGHSSIELFNNILDRLDDYRVNSGRDMDLAEIVSKGIKSILFDYYTELNRNARLALRTKLYEFYEKTMGISTLATKPFTEFIKNMISTKEPTSKPKYVKQYLDLRNDAFRYSRGKPLTSIATVTDVSKIFNIIPFYNSKSHEKRIKNDAEIVKPKKISTNVELKKVFKTSTHPYLEYAHEHSYVDKKVRKQTYQTQGNIKDPNRSYFVDDYDKQQSHTFKKNKLLGRVTPKEPVIENFVSKKFVTLDHELTTSKRGYETHERLLRSKTGHIKHKNSVLLQAKPTPYFDKSRHELKINNNFKPQLNTGINILKAPHKLSQGFGVENSFSYDHFDIDKFKNPVDKLRTIGQLQINPVIDRKPKFKNSKGNNILRATEPESLEIVAFDDINKNNKGLNINRQSEHLKKSNNKITFKASLERKRDAPITAKRIKAKKLTFMTLYPEFVQKWNAAKSHTLKKQHAGSTNPEQKDRFEIGSIHTTPHRTTKNTTNMEYNLRPKNIEVPIKNLKAKFQEPILKRKKNTKNNFNRPDVSEANHIRYLIAREKLKGFRIPQVDLPSGLGNSDENEFIDEIETKIPYGQSINNMRRDFLIDLNIPLNVPPRTEIKHVTDDRIYDTNNNYYVNSRPQQLDKINGYITNEAFKEIKNNLVESTNSNENTYVNYYIKPSTTQNIIIKTLDINDVDNEKKSYTNYIKVKKTLLNRSTSTIYSTGNKFKRYTDQAFHFDINKHNLTRRVFIDLQNTKNSKAGAMNNKGNNSSMTINLTRFNKKDLLGFKKYTINEEEVINPASKPISEINKKLSTMSYTQNNREPYDMYESTSKRKKIYFSYVNNAINKNGFYSLPIDKETTRKALNQNGSTMRDVADKFEYSKYVRKPERVTKLLQDNKDNNSGKETKFETYNQINQENVTNKFNKNILKIEGGHKYNIDKSERNIEKFEQEGIEGHVLNKKLDTNNLYSNTPTQNIEDEFYSVQNNKESIDIQNRISIDDGKFRTDSIIENETKKLNEIEQSSVPTKETAMNLKIQRRTLSSITFNDSNNKTAKFRGIHKFSTIFSKSIPVFTRATDETSKLTRNHNDDSKTTTTYLTKTVQTHIKDVNNITASISSGPLTKMTERNPADDRIDKLKQEKELNHSGSNTRNHFINVTPKLDENIKTSSATLNDFNGTSDIVN